MCMNANNYSFYQIWKNKPFCFYLDGKIEIIFVEAMGYIMGLSNVCVL